MISGEVAFLYAFDLANEIDTSKVQRVLSKKAVTLELELKKSRPRQLSFSKPLEIVPNLSKYKHAQQGVAGSVRIHEVGAVSLSFRVPFSVKSFQELRSYHQLRFENGKEIDEAARILVGKVRENIKDAFIHPHAQIPEPEAYTVFCVRDLGETISSEEVLEKHRADIVGLIADMNPTELSQSFIKEISTSMISFEKSDLVLVDWDAAFVMDTKAHFEDTLYALEVANLQLEEIKVLDSLIDQQLDGAYNDLRRQASLFSSNTQLALKTLRETRIDMSRLKDEISNTAKFFGDWYLAKVYLLAREKFKIVEWQKSVEEKLGHLNSLYSVIQTDTTNRKMVWLEALIVILFVIDLIAVFFMGH